MPRSARSRRSCSRRGRTSGCVTFEDAERGLCFGRLDLDGVLRPLYVGRRWVHEEQTPIVVNWQAPAARAFYTATVAEPQGVALRRRFRTEGRTLLDLYDEPLDGSAGDVIHGVADILLEELERSRDEHMRDIVATIQTDQYRLITREPDGVLVIQGGPGTGKTAVGLHRASWLLYTYRRELERSGVLVVGPNPVFMDYISHVLPMLGEERVEQRAVDELVAGAEATAERRAGRRAHEGRRAAGRRDRRRGARAARNRPPSSSPYGSKGSSCDSTPDQVGALVAEAQAESPNHAAGRDRLRMKLVRAFYERYTARLGVAAYHSFDDIEAALRTGGFLNRTLDTLWPRPKVEQFVRRLLTKPEALAAAADGDSRRGGAAAAPVGPWQGLVRLRPADRRRGAGAARRAGAPARPPDRRRGAGPDADAAADARPPLVGGDHDPRRHRPGGRAGRVPPVGRAARCLAPDAEVAVEELRLAYRVPADVMELALPLLPLIAPDVAPPIAYRAGDEPPRFVRAEPAHLVAAAVREAGRQAVRDGRTGLIAPAEILAQIEPLLTAPGHGVRRDVRADPGADSAASEGPRVRPGRARRARPHRCGGIEGLRGLYVALTRATKTLVIVHARAAPGASSATVVS